jgi:hypothetical protein
MDWSERLGWSLHNSWHCAPFAPLWDCVEQTAHRFLERIWWVVLQLMYCLSYIIRLFWASTSWTFVTVSRFWTIEEVQYLNHLCIPHVPLWIFEPFGAECYRFVMFIVMLKMLNVNYCQWPVMVTQFQSLQSAVDHTGHLCYQRVKLFEDRCQGRALLYVRT